jgi:arylsulfatase
VSLDPRLPNIADALVDAGYRTHGVGKYHLSPFRTPFGVDPASVNAAEWPETLELWEAGRVSALPAPYYGLQTALHVGGHGGFHWGDYRRWLMREKPGVLDAINAWRSGERRPTEPSRIPADVHPSHWIADRTIDFLREQAYTGQPFFCWCSFPDPHHPYHAPEPYRSWYDPADMPVPVRREGEIDDMPPFYHRVQVERIRLEGINGPMQDWYHLTPEIIAATYGMVSNIDVNVGRVLDALQDLGMWENTIIVYLSDHGDLMGDHWLQQKGPFHYQGLIRVPFIWSWPGQIEAGKINSDIVSMLDFAPTLLDLCGVPTPEGARPPEDFLPHELPPWPGHSLWPALEGQRDDVRDVAFVDHDDDRLGLRLRTLVTERYRLTWYGGQSYGELFDLQEDPDELYNLWGDAGRRRLRDELAARLLEEAIMSDSRLPRRLSIY